MAVSLFLSLRGLPFGALFNVPVFSADLNVCVKQRKPFDRSSNGNLANIEHVNTVQCESVS